MLSFWRREGEEPSFAPVLPTTLSKKRGLRQNLLKDRQTAVSSRCQSVASCDLQSTISSQATARLPKIVPPPSLLCKHQTFRKDLPNLPQHDACLQLPPSLSHLWLLLPPDMQIDPQDLLQRLQGGQSPEEAMATHLLGASGPGVLASFAQASKPGPNSLPKLGSTEQAAKIASGPAFSSKKGNDNVPGRSVMNPRKTARLDLSACTRRALADDTLSFHSGLLGIAGIASGPSPDHTELMVKNVDFENLSLISMWQQVQKVDINGGKLKSLSGIEKCKKLEKLSITNCTGLVSVRSLAQCKSLRSVSLRNCPDLKSCSGLEELPQLEFVDLSGCHALKAEKLYKLQMQLQRNPASFIMWPSIEMMNSFAATLDPSAQTSFMKASQRHLKAHLEKTMQRASDLHQSCLSGGGDWISLKSELGHLNKCIQYAVQLGVDSQYAKHVQDAYRDWKLQLYLNHELSSEEIECLKHFGGYGLRFSLKRCISLIKWLNIRAENRMSLPEFVTTLHTLGYPENKSDLKHVFRILDTERRGVITRRNLEVIESGEYEGPADLSTLNDFRCFVEHRDGGIQTFTSTLLKMSGSSTGEINYHDFCETVSEMGWRSKLDEIFVALDHQYKGKISEQHLLSVRLCFLPLVSQICQAFCKKYGSLAKAFKAIDDNGSGAISSDEFTKALEQYRFDPDDGLRLFRLLDLDHSGIISRPEFEGLATLADELYCKELGAVVDHALNRYKSMENAFEHIIKSSEGDQSSSRTCSKENGRRSSKHDSAAPENNNKEMANKKASLLQSASQKSKLVGRANVLAHFSSKTAFLKRSDFKAAMASAGFTLKSDPFVLFQLLDHDGTNAISMTSWRTLATITAGSDRVHVARFWSWLAETFGNAADAWSALEKAREAAALAKKASRRSSQLSISK